MKVESANVYIGENEHQVVAVTVMMHFNPTLISKELIDNLMEMATKSVAAVIACELNQNVEN